MLQLLTTENFRNYSRQTIRLTPGVNALIGQNGQGKTNLLEAVYYLSLLRSFRTTKVANLVACGSQSFSLYGEVLAGPDQRLTRLGVSNGQERRLVVDGQPIRRASEFISRLVVAAFLPGDLAIVQGAPGERRTFLNIALCQLSTQYLTTLVAYNEALKNRNAMLKAPEQFPRETVTAYDHLLAHYGAHIEVARHRFAQILDQAVNRQSRLFFPDGRRLGVKFLNGLTAPGESMPEDESAAAELYLDALARSYERDLREGATRLGPHRSDLGCLLNDKPLAQFGSEGECRTAAIALRFGVLELLREQKGQSDITMIVDDVLGELDNTRRTAFLEQLTSSGQVVFAGTALPQGFGANVKLFHVNAGTIGEA